MLSTLNTSKDRGTLPHMALAIIGGFRYRYGGTVRCLGDGFLGEVYEDAFSGAFFCGFYGGFYVFWLDGGCSFCHF